MCWRQVSKLQKSVCIAISYITFYILLSYALSSEVTVTFVSDDFRVGDKYVLMFLDSRDTPVFTDSEAADVFRARRCRYCILTNNRGFLPLSEYDAILVNGEKNVTETFMEPGKRYLVEASGECLRSKFSDCLREPVVTSYGTGTKYSLCQLCRELLLQRRKRRPEP